MAARLDKMVTDLRRSEATTRAIVDKSLTGILLTDRDGSVLQANPAAVEMFDYAASEILEQNHSDLVEPPVSDGGRHRAGEVRNEEDTKSINATYETVGHRQDGSVFPIVLARSHVNLADHQQVLMMITDISAAKHAENEITAAKEKAEQASQAKSFFLASMSHELRTPMNAVLGFAQLLDQDQIESLSDRHGAFVDEILRSGYYMMELIGDVLDLQAIESGSLKQEIEEQELRSLLDAAITMVVSAAEERGITVAILPPAEDRPVVQVDGLHFKKVILNLLSNAIKYNRPDGQVAVDWTHESNGQLRIRVADTGNGIPEELRDRVFQPFDRLGVETSAVMGTGIGLTIAKRLIEAMDGHIGFDSAPGVGCTFWLDVPVVPI